MGRQRFGVCGLGGVEIGVTPLGAFVLRGLQMPPLAGRDVADPLLELASLPIRLRVRVRVRVRVGVGVRPPWRSETLGSHSPRHRG